MKIVKFISVLFGVLVCLVVYLWFRPPSVVLYSYEDLVGVTCATLSQKHEEVITSHHDAALDYFHRKGEFPVGLGLPPEEQLPFNILIEAYVRDADMVGGDLSVLFVSAAPQLRSHFFSAMTGVCAARPEMLAMDAAVVAVGQIGLPKVNARP